MVLHPWAGVQRQGEALESLAASGLECLAHVSVSVSVSVSVCVCV